MRINFGFNRICVVGQPLVSDGVEDELPHETSLRHCRFFLINLFVLVKRWISFLFVV
jgi:hypothetical protein